MVFANLRFPFFPDYPISGLAEYPECSVEDWLSSLVWRAVVTPKRGDPLTVFFQIADKNKNNNISIIISCVYIFLVFTNNIRLHWE